MPTTNKPARAAGTVAGHSAARSAPSLKMKDLERATGVGREAIRYYIHAGLLPEPRRLGRNVALYDASFVEHIRLIKELQQKRFLPLRVIKAIVDGDTALAPAEVQTLVDLDRHLFRAAGIDLRRPPVKLAAVAGRTGVPAAEIRQLAAVDAIEVTSRKGVEWLHEHDVRVVELWARVRAAGFTAALGFKPDVLRLHVDMIRWLTREELRVFTRGVTGKTDPEQFRAMAGTAIEIVNELLGVLHRNFFPRFIADGNVPPASKRPTPKKVQQHAKSLVMRNRP